LQGRSLIATAVTKMPFSLTVFFTEIVIVRFHNRWTPRQIGRYGFIDSSCARRRSSGLPLSLGSDSYTFIVLPKKL
jgi:hypothetical protein